MTDPSPALETLRSKPPKANPEGPHWLVKRMGKGKRGPSETSSRSLFPHPTEELANKEAERLATLLPGARFRVYAACKAFQVAKPPAPKVEP